MQKKILVFGASNSRKSINSRFAEVAASQLTNVELNLIKLYEFDLPIYSVDHEKNFGIPEDAQKFFSHIKMSDGIIASFAEHNGLYTSAFKNLWDWISRIEDMNVWQGKPMFHLSTSPSKKEKNYVTKVSLDLFPAFGAKIISNYVLPSFHHFFRDNQITEVNHALNFDSELRKFQEYLNQI